MKQGDIFLLTGMLLIILILALSVYETKERKKADTKFNSRIEILNLKDKLRRNEIQTLENKVQLLQRRINEFDTVTVKATAYTKSEDETDSTPNESACMVNPPVGSIAVSQDLFYKGWTCGKWVKIKQFGIFKIRKILDVMHQRKTKQIDIVKETKEEANLFGIKRNLNAVLLTHYEKM